MWFFHKFNGLDTIIQCPFRNVGGHCFGKKINNKLVILGTSERGEATEEYRYVCSTIMMDTKRESS
jgi:hypothetical protein